MQASFSGGPKSTGLNQKGPKSPACPTAQRLSSSGRTPFNCSEPSSFGKGEGNSSGTMRAPTPGGLGELLLSFLRGFGAFGDRALRSLCAGSPRSLLADTTEEMSDFLGPGCVPCCVKCQGLLRKFVWTSVGFGDYAAWRQACARVSLRASHA